MSSSIDASTTVGLGAAGRGGGTTLGGAGGAGVVLRRVPLIRDVAGLPLLDEMRFVGLLR